MAYIDWWNRTGPITMGERFGLNEISTRAKTLSPTKSHTQVASNYYVPPRDSNPPWIHYPSNDPKAHQQILEDFDISEETMHKDGGRIDMKPGGIVEPGVTHYALTDVERSARYREKHRKTTSLEFTAKGEKITVDIPQLRPDSKLKFKELINGVEKWKVEPTTENWIKIFKKKKGSGKGPQQYTYGWSTELRKFLQGEETAYPLIKKIFEQTDIKKVLGLDKEHVKMIKSYKNLQSPAIATIIAKEKALYASAKKAIQINKIFKTNPEITLEALTREIHKKDFARAGKIGKVEMMTTVSNDVARYLEALSKTEEGIVARVIPRGLKSKWIPPTGKNLKNIKDYIFSQSGGFRFQDQTLRDYKYAIRDSILKLKPNTSLALEAKLAKIKGAADHVVSLSAVYKNAPGYLEAIQKIEGAINAAKSNKLDKPFKEALELAFKGDFSKVDTYNELATKFQKAKNIDVPFIRPGGDPTQTVKYFTEFSEGAQENILKSAKKTGVALETKTMPLTEKTLKTFLQQVKNTPKGPGRLRIISTLIGAGVGLPVLNKYGISSAEAAKADTLEPSDKKQETSVIGDVASAVAENPIKSAAAVIGGDVALNKAKLSLKTLRGVDRALGPWMTPLIGLYTAITGEPPDPTSAANLLIPSFWNSIMKRYNWQDKSADPLKRRIINAAKRGLIPTNLMPVISRASGIGTAMFGAKYVAEESQPNIFRDDKGDLRMKDDQITTLPSNMIKDYHWRFASDDFFEKEYGITKDQYKSNLPEFLDLEKQKAKKPAPFDSYFMGGIASLIK